MRIVIPKATIKKLTYWEIQHGCKVGGLHLLAPWPRLVLQPSYRGLFSMCSPSPTWKSNREWVSVSKHICRWECMGVDKRLPAFRPPGTCSLGSLNRETATTVAQTSTSGCTESWWLWICAGALITSGKERQLEGCWLQKQRGGRRTTPGWKSLEEAGTAPQQHPVL